MNKRAAKNLENGLYNIGFERAKLICEESDREVEELDIPYPEELHEWFEEINSEQIKKEKRRNRYRRYRKYSSRAALVFFVLIGMLGILTISSQAFRVRFYNMMIDTNEKYSVVSFEGEVNSDSIPDDWIDYMFPKYLPSDYEVSEVKGTGDNKWISFKHEDGHYINLMQSSLGGNLYVDTEDAAVERMEINGRDALIVEEDGFYQVIWNSERHQMVVISNEVLEVIIKVVENIEYKW